MNIVMVLGMLVCVNLSISVCMLIVLNAMLMSNATVMVRYGDSFWLNLSPREPGCFRCLMLMLSGT